MVSFTDRLRLEQQDTGSNQNTWGSILNTDMIAMVDEAFGLETIALTGANITLTTANGSTDQARNMAFRFTGTGGATVTLPSVQQAKLIINDSTAAVAISTGGTAASVRLVCIVGSPLMGRTAIWSRPDLIRCRSQRLRWI